MKKQTEYLIGLDLGTSMLKGIAMRIDGTIAATQKAGMVYHRGENGCVEFDAEWFYRQIASLLRNLVQTLPQNASIAGISMASASGNTLLCDKNWKPLLPVISWLDQRDAGETAQVFRDIDREAIHQTVGWPYLAAFPIAHLAWLKAHKPDLLKSAAHIGMSTDYLYFCLTGRYMIDPSTATTGYLQEQTTRSWNMSMLHRYGIGQEQLPVIFPSGSMIGRITEKASLETGLPAGTPVVLGAFDHPCAARGAQVTKKGQLLLSCGTSWVGFYPTENRGNAVAMRMLIDPFLSDTGPWGAMFSLSAISQQIERYITYYISDRADRYQSFNRLAQQAMLTTRKLLIDPTQAFNRKLSPEYTPADISRGLMEGVAELLKQSIQGYQKGGIKADSITMVGGGSTMPWPQYVANVLDMPVTVRNGSHAGAVGAAILAGIATGRYASLDDAYQQTRFPYQTLVPKG